MRLAGVSGDSVTSHERFRAKLGLGFPLLSDPDHRVMEAYGAWGEKKSYGRTTRGALRSTVVIGPDGTLERVYANVKAAGHAQKVLDDLEAAAPQP